MLVQPAEQSSFRANHQVRWPQKQLLAVLGENQPGITVLTNVLNHCVWQRVKFSFLDAKSLFIRIFLIFSTLCICWNCYFEHTLQ